MISLFCRANGMASVWIGVGFLKFNNSHALQSGSINPSDENVTGLDSLWFSSFSSSTCLVSSLSEGGFGFEELEDDASGFSS